jgi:hypothetical protein
LAATVFVIVGGAVVTYLFALARFVLRGDLYDY